MSNPETLSKELYRQDGENFRSVMARVKDDTFQVDTQDMGPIVEQTWGDSDYEFWTIVPKDAWGQLLLALTTEMFEGDARATDKLKDICEAHGVPYTWGSYA